MDIFVDIDYLEYNPANPDCVNKHVLRIIAHFSKHHKALMKDLGESLPINEAQLESWTKMIGIDVGRLQEAVQSALEDMKRCVDFHKLYDKNTKVIDACHHKACAFFIKWFMCFRPIHADGVLRELNVIMSKAGTSIPSNIAEAYLEIFNINEFFIFQTSIRSFLTMPFEHIAFMRPIEKRDILYALKYRIGRMQGVDLSMMLHWMQETLYYRSTDTEIKHGQYDTLVKESPSRDKMSDDAKKKFDEINRQHAEYEKLKNLQAAAEKIARQNEFPCPASAEAPPT